MLFKWIPAGARALLLGKAHFALRLAEAKVAVTLTADAEPETPGNDGDVRMERIPLHFPLDKADRESCGEMLRSAACDAVVADGLEGAVTPEKLHELVREIELALSSSGTAVVLLDGASSTKTLSPEFVIALFERFGFALAERKSAGDRGSLTSTALVFVRDAARVRARKSLQGLLEEDRMTTTYKLALIKALAEINLANAARVRYLLPADMTAYLVRTKIPDAPHQAAIPMGLVIERVVALYWQIYRAHALNASARLPAQIGGTIKIEKNSYRSYQRNFGRSTNRTGMGEFVAHLKRKAESAGGEVIELDAYKLKMSQFDPATDSYRKKPLKERWHRWGTQTRSCNEMS